MNPEFSVKRDIAKLLNELAKTDREIKKELKKITQISSLVDGWFPASHVKEELGITHSTLNRYMSEGLLPYSKIGKRLMFNQKDILALLDRNYRRY